MAIRHFARRGKAAAGAGTATWGSISGTLSDQTDLQALLDAKADLAGTETISGAWTFTNAANVFKGLSLEIRDAGDTDGVVFSHDGAELDVVATNTNQIKMSGFTAGLLVRDGGAIAVQDGTNLDAMTFWCDGTDANIQGTSVANLNLSGFTAIDAAAVDADFDAITATSYGGITEANLIDKTASETFTGNHVHSQVYSIWQGTSGGTAQYIDLDVSWTAAAIYGPGIRWREADGTVISAMRGWVDTSDVKHLEFGHGWLTQILDLHESGADITGALTATSYGGITEANLLDKSASETISGAYSFSTGIDFGAEVAASDTDVSRHVDLYGGNYGIGITASTMNFVINAANGFNFHSTNGMTINGDVTTTGNLILNNAAGVSQQFDVGSSANDADVHYRIAGTLTALVRWDSSANQLQWSDRNPSTVTSMIHDFDNGTLWTLGPISTSGNIVEVEGASPRLNLWETGGTADEQKWRIMGNGGQLICATLNDAESVSASVWTVDRTGTTVDSITFHAPITATSYGGITEANLVDKSATESISGEWTFTTAPVINAVSPLLKFYESDAGVDEKFWFMGATGSDSFNLLTRTDAGSAGETVFSFTRSGTAITKGIHYGDKQYLDGCNSGTSFTIRPDSLNELATGMTALTFDHVFGMVVDNDSDIIGVELYTQGGTENARSAYFHDATALEYGLAQTWSSAGQMEFKIYSGGNNEVTGDFANNLFSFHNSNNIYTHGGSLFMEEKAAADADTAARGQLWVKNTTPCQLWFTDDAGTDTQIV
jgi:hypothetical protein